MFPRVKHYGLHTDPTGVKHLLQEALSGNFIGLPVEPPFELKLEVNRPCPHSMDLAVKSINGQHWRQFLKLVKDPLVSAMLPVPKRLGDKVLYFNDEHQALLVSLMHLARLASPARQLVYPVTQMPFKQLLEELKLTNVAPLVLTGIMTEHQMKIEKLVHESLVLPRRLILMGHPTIVAYGMIVRERTVIHRDFEPDLPMEDIGVEILRRFARGERVAL